MCPISSPKRRRTLVRFQLGIASGLLATTTAVHALVYEVRGEDGRLGNGGNATAEADEPYAGPLHPGPGYTASTNGFVWSYRDPASGQREWARLDKLLADGIAESALIVDGDADAAYVALDPGLDGDKQPADTASALLAGWDWTRCCNTDSALAADPRTMQLDLNISGYSSLSPWYLLTGDVLKPAPKTPLGQSDAPSAPNGGESGDSDLSLLLGGLAVLLIAVAGGIFLRRRSAGTGN